MVDKLIISWMVFVNFFKIKFIIIIANNNTNCTYHNHMSLTNILNEIISGKTVPKYCVYMTKSTSDFHP